MNFPILIKYFITSILHYFLDYRSISELSYWSYWIERKDQFIIWKKKKKKKQKKKKIKKYQKEMMLF